MPTTPLDEFNINLRATSVTTGRAVHLTWTEPAGYSPLGWKLKRSTVTFALFHEDEVQTIATLPAGTLEYLDEDLAEGVAYYYTLFWGLNEDDYANVSDSQRVIGLSLEDYKAAEGEFIYDLIPPGVRQVHESQPNDGDVLNALSDVIQQGIHVQRGLVTTLGWTSFDQMLAGRIGQPVNQYAQIEATLRGYGYEPLRYAGVAAMRRVGEALAFVRSWKGTCRGVSAYVKALTTWDSSCVVPGDATCGGFGGLRTFDGESRTRRYDYESDTDLVTIAAGTFTDPAQSWTVDEFAGGAMRTALGQYLCIASNTEDTLVFENPEALVQLYVLVTGTTSTGTLTLVGRGVDEGRGFCQTAFATEDLMFLLDVDELEYQIPVDSNVVVGPPSEMSMPAFGGFLDGDCTIRTRVGVNYSLRYTLFAGPHYTTLFPEHDVTLKGTLRDPFNPLYGGVSDEAGVPPGPFDVIIVVQEGVAAATGTASAIGVDTLEDSTANWTVDEFVGFKLNPNRNNTLTYTVLSNTATTITVDVSEAPDVNLVSVAGAEYFILSRRNEVAYRALVSSVEQFLFQGVRPYVWFEGAGEGN